MDELLETPADEGLLMSEIGERIKGRQGFASMDPVRRKAIASQGGKAAHVKGTAHEWDADSARAAGQKGGAASVGKPRRRQVVFGPKQGVE